MAHAVGNILLVALGGAVGAVSRYGLSHVIHMHPVGKLFPWGTLACNVVGCAVMGLLWTAADGHVATSPTWRPLVLVGLLGGFTTFSTFSVETMNQFAAGHHVAAALNVAGTLVACLAGVFGGATLGRMI